MSLLRDIQTAAISDDTPLPVVLRMCRVLAQRVDSDQLATWANAELNGYEDEDIDTLPPYRRFPVEARGNFSGFFQSRLLNQPIPRGSVKPEHRDALFTAELCESVGSYEAALRTEREHLRISWPQDLVVLYQDAVLDAYVLTEAWKAITRGSVVGVLEQIRNRALSFVLDLERAFPHAGDDLSQIRPRGAVSQIFTTNVYGGTNIVASGSGHQILSAESVLPGDWNRLVQLLRSIGLDEDSIADLARAVREDGDVSTGEPGPRVLAWLGEVQARIVRGTLSVGTSAAGGVIATAVVRYLGLG